MGPENFILLNLSKKRKLKNYIKLYCSSFLIQGKKKIFSLTSKERKKMYCLQEKYKYLFKVNYMKVFYISVFFRFYEYQSLWQSFNPRKNIFLKFLFLHFKKNFEYFSNLTTLENNFPNVFIGKKKLYSSFAGERIFFNSQFSLENFYIFQKIFIKYNEFLQNTYQDLFYFITFFKKKNFSLFKKNFFLEFNDKIMAIKFCIENFFQKKKSSNNLEIFFHKVENFFVFPSKIQNNSAFFRFIFITITKILNKKNELFLKNKIFYFLKILKFLLKTKWNRIFFKNKKGTEYRTFNFSIIFTRIKYFKWKILKKTNQKRIHRHEYFLKLLSIFPTKILKYLSAFENDYFFFWCSGKYNLFFDLDSNSKKVFFPKEKFDKKLSLVFFKNGLEKNKKIKNLFKINFFSLIFQSSQKKNFFKKKDIMNINFINFKKKRVIDYLFFFIFFQELGVFLC